MSLFLCPTCLKPLTLSEKEYNCTANHRFDRAAEGYVNLLSSNKMNSKAPGDDKDMVKARNRFLTAGYYDALKNALVDICLEKAVQSSSMLDSGCGEGYYTNCIATAYKDAKIKVQVAGIDISKTAVKLASKRLKNAEFAVASAYHLPVKDESIDILLNCFSPLCEGEFLRVLKKGGYFIYIVPAPRHLWQLKEAIYDLPYENKHILTEYKGFEQLESTTVEDVVFLPNNETIKDLFSMTPYIWKTSIEDISRLNSLPNLKTEIAFDILIYKKM